MNFSEAFAVYGGKLRNVQWAVSTIHDGQLIVSCWQHLFSAPQNGAVVYEDRLSRFSGPGNNLLREHLRQAVDDNLPVRVVIARSSNPDAVDAGQDASKFEKTFSVKRDWVGKIEEYDGDYLRISFQSNK